MKRVIHTTLSFLAFLSAFLIFSQAAKAQPTSAIVYLDQNGKLVYKPYDEKGDRLPDFSYCGYMGGGVALPEVPVRLTLEPDDLSDEDHTRIQKAIDEVGRMPLNAQGLRGAVLLRKGRYKIRQTLYIRQAGVVVRGEGDDENGTTLVCTEKKQYDLFRVGTSAAWEEEKASRQPIRDGYVPSGSRTFTVADASGFKVGDEVIIERPSTREWIRCIGMDKLPARWEPVEGLSDRKIANYKKRGLLNEDGTQYDATIQWASGSKNLFFMRKVTAIEGHKLTVDAPITNALQQEFGGGSVYRYRYPEGLRPEQIGIERLRVESLYDPKVMKTDRNIGRYCADEKHAQYAVTFAACRNTWVRNVTTLYMGHGFSTTKNCSYNTIQDCRYLDPVAQIKGGRRYGYSVGGQMCLVQRCYSRNARHDLAFGASVPGPNACVDNWGDSSHSAVETHQRWAAGGLFDNCRYEGPGTSLNCANRGSSGTGHGWSGAQIVFWNCRSRYTLVMRPPTGQNFSIGNAGRWAPDENKEWMSAESIQRSIDYFNQTSGRDFQYVGVPVLGDAHIEFPETYVNPPYLYYKQLWDRLGEKAVKQVTTREQQQSIFN